MKYRSSVASARATSIEPFVPFAPSDRTISAPNKRRSPIRSSLALSGITTVSLYPLRRATIASAMPVLPDVGSRIVRSDVSSPEPSAASTMARAIRSFVEPVGFCPSSFAQIRTPGAEDIRGMPTSGVSPMASRMASKRTIRDYLSARRASRCANATSDGSSQDPPRRVDRDRARIGRVAVQERRGSVTGVTQHPHPGETGGATVLRERIQELLTYPRRSHRLRHLEACEDEEVASIGP